jgi:hypothetical protein
MSAEATVARVKLHDAEIGQVNARAPSGVSDRIQTTELKARGLDRLLQPEIEIAKELRLPAFDRKDGPLLAWPPHERSLAEQMAARVVLQCRNMTGAIGLLNWINASAKKKSTTMR